MPNPSAFEDEMTNEKIKRHKAPVIDHIPAEMIKAGGRTIRSEIHKLINFVGNKEEFSEEWKESVIVLFIRRAIKQIVVVIETYHFCQLRT
jgi:hypothetical protein